MFKAKQAVRTRRPLKISMEGLSGGGKTYTALRIAFDMKRNGIGKRILVIDSENESAGLYAGQAEDGERWDFDTVDMPAQKRNPGGYAEAYEWAVSQGYDILIFDSLSHAWHGALEQVDQYAASHRNDKFGAWANVTPQQRMMLQTLTDPRAHCLTTLRVKTEFEDVVVNGRTKKQKVGMKADQREGTEYEFDLVLRFEAGNEVSVDKVRGCTAMNGKTVTKPGPAFWKPLFEWWKAGADVPAPNPPQPLANNPGGQHSSPDADAVVGHEANMLESQSLGELQAATDLIKIDKNLTAEGRKYLGEVWKKCDARIRGKA